MNKAKARKARTLRGQRVRARRKTRLWAFVGRVLGSAFIKITILITVIVILSAVFIYCYEFVLTSPFFSLKRLEIAGVDKQEQIRIAQLCGIKEGANLLALKLNEMRETLEKDPWVRTARVERRLPDTLFISVVREEPWAIVISEKLYYMNRWGEIFKEVGAGEPVDLPVVTGLSDLGSEAGEELRAVASFIEAIKREHGLIGVRNLSEVHIDDGGHISVYFKTIPCEVQVATTGLGVQIAKLRRLVRHLSQTGKIHQASRIDLSYSGGAVVSFRSGTVGARRGNKGA